MSRDMSRSMKRKSIVAHESRANRTQTLRLNDLITVREAMALVENNINAYHRQFHVKTPWYRRLAARFQRKPGSVARPEPQPPQQPQKPAA